MLHPGFDPRRISASWGETLGYRADEILGRPFLDFVHPSDVEPPTQERAAQVEEEKTVFHFENRYRHKDGSYRWLEWTSHPDSETGLTFAIARDVTGIKEQRDELERYRTQLEEMVDERTRELRESEERLAVTLNSIGDAVISTDKNGCISFMNPTAERATGWGMKEAAGKPLDEVFDIRNEETGDRVENPVKRVFREGKVVGLANHTKLIRRDGTELPIADSGAPIRDEAGEINGVVLVFQDITERRREEEALRASEERYQDLYDSAPDMFVSVDPVTARILRCNQTIANATGYTREEIIGRPIFDMYHPDCMKDAKNAFQSFVQHGKVSDAELQLRRKDGSKIDVSLNVSAVRDEQGQILYSRSSWRDITDCKRMEDELRDSRDRLRDLTIRLDEVREEERTKLARELHDEVGQALTAMRMDLTMVEAGLPAGEKQLADLLHSMLDLAQDSVDRVNRMSHDLRSPVLELLGLAAAVESEALEYQERWGTAIGLEIEVGELEALPERDRTVCRLLREALANVRQHAEASRVEVGLRVAGEEMVLEVLDDGIGITDDQSHGKRSFGLIGMQERVGRLGGAIVIEQRPEGGTRVMASVPITPKSRGLRSPSHPG